jgi:hypothetical protein
MSHVWHAEEELSTYPFPRPTLCDTLTDVYSHENGSKNERDHSAIVIHSGARSLFIDGKDVYCIL